MSSIYITSVNSSEFTVDSTTHELSVLKIDSSKITGLEDALNKKASEASVKELSTKVTTLETKLNNYVLQE
jgi:hypothetical protein